MTTVSRPRLPTWARASLCAALVGGFIAPAAWAERADRLAPMNVEADALRYDDARQTSVFTGNVVVTKGTIVIRGRQVEVRQDAQGHQFGTVLGSPGQRAFFRQKREALDEYIEGEALRIEYDSQADTVKFFDQAVLRRYRGPALNDQTAGSVIVYDNRTEVFTVDSAPGARTPDNPSGRVRAMLTPRPDPNAPATPSTPATPGPALQPSPRLESGR